MTSMYIAPRRFAPASMAYRPSGDASLTSAQIAQFQCAMTFTGNSPRNVNSITGRLPIASADQLRSFQRNYNLENARLNYRFSPRSLTEDGQWGPATRQALTNYISAAAGAQCGVGVSIANIPGGTVPVLPTDGYGGQQANSITPWVGPIPTSNVTAPKTGGATDTKGGGTAAPQTSIVRPQTASPTVLPAPVSGQQAASTFPTGPVVAGAVGLAAIVGVVVWKRSQKRKGK